MSYKGAVDHLDAGDIEVFHLTPSWHDEGVLHQVVSVAPLDNREISLIVSKLYKNHQQSFTHIIFTEIELEMLIEALQECKKRWDEGKVIGENK